MESADRQRSIGPPPTRWTDDMAKVAGSWLMQAAESYQGDYGSTRGGVMSSNGRPTTDVIMKTRSFNFTIN